MKTLFLLIGIYVLTGIVLYLIDMSKAFKDRPLALSNIPFVFSKNQFLNVLCYILFSPAFVFDRIGARKKYKYISVNASGEEKRIYNLGTIANSQGKYKLAIEYFSKVIKMNPNFSEAYVNRGTAYSRLKDPKANSSFYDEQINNAISDFDKAIEIDPKNGYAYYNRAVAKYIEGNFNEALLDIQKAKELGFTDTNPDFEKEVRLFIEGHIENRDSDRFLK